MKRFYDKVAIPTNDPNGCWEWIGYCGAGGYGQFRFNEKIEKAHRVAYLLNYRLEEIPVGMKVCHTCDNPACVNPSHLFLGTQKDNMQDCKSKGRVVSEARMTAQTRGSDRYNAKLNEKQAREVHAMFARGISKAKIARHFGVSYSCTNNILLGISWKHLIVKGVLK